MVVQRDRLNGGLCHSQRPGASWIPALKRAGAGFKDLEFDIVNSHSRHHCRWTKADFERLTLHFGRGLA